MKRKFIIMTLAVLLLAGVAGTFWGSSIARRLKYLEFLLSKQDQLRLSGDCRSYIDTNNDGYATAASQPARDLKLKRSHIRQQCF